MSGSSVGWRVDVTPDGNGEVTITLPTSQAACNPNSVPCTRDDGRRLSAPASVTVRGSVPWVTGSTSFTAVENQTAVATLTASDIKTPNGPFTWSIPAGAAGGVDRDKFTLSSTGALAFVSAKDLQNPDDADSDGIYEVTVQVRDGDSLTGTADLTVTLTKVNEAPTANAGPSQFAVQSGATVTLSGSGSDDLDAGDTLIYAWTQTGGATVSLMGDNTATATFTAPATFTQATILTFRLRVTDSGGLHHDDTVTVSGGQAPEPPVITSATSLRAAENQTAVATLTATDADTPAADLTWSIPSGAAGGADGGKFTLSSTGVLAFRVGEGLREPRRRRYEPQLRGLGRGRRRRPDGHGGPDGDAGERQRRAHRRCGRRPDRHRARRDRDAERSGKRSGRGRHPDLRLDADGQ